MVRLALHALAAAVIFSFVPVIGSAAAQASRRAGFELPAIKGGYPGRVFQFEREQARLLASELLPVVMDDVTRISVREDIILPLGAYAGLTTDIALNVGVDYSDFICEERHVYIVFSYKGPDVDLREMRRIIRDGAIENHTFGRLYSRNRYFAMPEKAVSHDAALAKCHSLAGDTSGWREASNLLEYVVDRKRISALINSLAALPMSQIHCLNSDGKACNYERSKILALVQAAPPEGSELLVVPNDGAITVYKHYGYNDAAPIDYTITLRAGEADRPLSLDIRLSKSFPLPPA